MSSKVSNSTVFFDVDTQIDFLYPAGALYVPGAEPLLGTLERLNRYTESRGIPLISTMCAHAENDAEFRDWPPHCVKGCLGQLKPPRLMLGRHRVIASTPNAAFEEAPQYILEKQMLDCFSNPNLIPLLNYLNPERCVVYGVVTEYCVRCAALGLLNLGKHVELVEDAIQTLSGEAREKFFAEFTARGGRLTQADQVCR